ncbi:hypothetical protein LMH87_010964 [Akanthomyces muscarius]|uniref:C6 transcription factor n=2 Tax=Akanthomyces TaxID=150366 RepID=A0A162IW70_CORDF|nr:hypothetical protein LMH87_010964 [Akanthomyces muscarius]KAJ4150205.1 hypothetical protein LMH87_010964 [Akanthomyces muscarius]OAA78985.1 C6 transcription factor [Akanthomyces lecanii RCEF 1005]
MSDSGSPGTPASSSGCSDVVTRAKRRPIPRKGHTKSRGGCANCKKRKVKCDEVTPACGACRRLGYDCLYFENKLQVKARREEPLKALIVSQKPAKTLSCDPSWFTLDDMRFFQHFIFSAYPSLPLDGWDIWREVSQMAHQYDFLLHAMLGLGASHLSIITPNSYTRAALRHRVTALEGFKKFISTAGQSREHADAAFATALVLTFQATQMRDGLNDFLTMIRGCNLIGTHASGQYASSRFAEFEKELYLNKLMKVVPLDRPIPHFDEEAIGGFLGSLENLGPLCRSIEELQYLAIMRSIATQALQSPVSAFYEHTRIYDVLCDIDAEQFPAFIDESNYTGRLLIMHMIVLDYVMGTTILQERRQAAPAAVPKNVYDYIKMMLLTWTQRIQEKLPEEFKPYGLWPVTFTRQCIDDGEMKLVDSGGDTVKLVGETLRELIL